MVARINIRINDSEKEILENAAAVRGLSLTDFLTQSALEASREAAPVLRPVQGTFTGIPSFLNASFRTATQGGPLGYQNAGWQFACGLTSVSLEPNDFEGGPGEWAELVDQELSPILEEASDDGLPPEGVKAFKAWMNFRYPVLAEKIPSRRWEQFIKGVVQAHWKREIF